jgi:hypothetical protein
MDAGKSAEQGAARGRKGYGRRRERRRGPWAWIRRRAGVTARAGAKTQRNPSELGKKERRARETSGGRRGVKYSAWGFAFLMLSPSRLLWIFALYYCPRSPGPGPNWAFFRWRSKGGMCRPGRDFRIPEPTRIGHVTSTGIACDWCLVVFLPEPWPVCSLQGKSRVLNRALVAKYCKICSILK